MNKEGTLLFAEDAGTVVRTIFGDMGNHSIILLELTCKSGIICNRREDWHKRLDSYRCSGRSLNNGLSLHHWLFHLTRTARDVIDNAHTGLGHDENLLLGAYLRTAMATLVTVELGITDSCSDVGLEIPIAT